MNSLIENIQNYGPSASIIYILILHWNEFERCLIKKDNSLLERIETGLLPDSTIYKFGITASLLILIISAIIASFVYSNISNVYLFIIFFLVITVSLSILFLKYYWHKSMLHKKLYITDPAFSGDSFSKQSKIFVYVTKEGEDKYIFRLHSKDTTNSEYIYVTKLEIFSNYFEYTDQNE
ncbi:Hypothetical protein TART1_0605 [Trichococcus shcherbakoviae]|uniref:Uncharacterized protein n=1 Tax=Trichococcus shcherbakoviae TaxID=2094020 RepID=A0A383TCE4_9LACT|nr:Hypothetical protein TART1_0605 [Trichococcus shcherbakoviae]